MNIWIDHYFVMNGFFNWSLWIIYLTLTLIWRLDMVVYLKPLVSSSVLVVTPSMTSVLDSFQVILAAGFPPLDIHVRLSVDPSDADSLPLESA